ncbi:MAG TPA: gliding motility-associated C-terminal domain-containing protein [Chryseosolibacter sp.]|nr:gliding motility-associated C-terminal domain-containing protein [Chryseosolibacter sp.]
MLRWSLFALSLLLVQSNVHAQVDTEFWFAPPEVTAGHGDQPLYLRISTLNQAAVVSVVQPGRNNIKIAGANIPANTTHTIDLTSEITNLETILPATVMKTGIRITSSTPVTAYYEVGAPWNSDIFALKGRNALGNNFVIPAQDFYDNSGQYYPNPSSSFDIVATRDNTVVKVRPTKPIVGHLTDTVITVKLNAGETYSFRKTTLLASDNPGGTIVESNKPIAITIKDDSVINGGCRDILGDQLVPVEVAGSEYVVLKGFLTTQEYLFITATEDDTQIFIGDGASPVSVLSAGQVFRHPVTQKSTYIRSNHIIYVFHVTGFGCEMGLAILPSINCKGSPQIGFTRTTDEFFGLNVLVRKEGISKFILNGSSSLIPASAFTAVNGTNDEWYTAQLSFNTMEIPVGRASLISNPQNSFQVGIINGNATSTCRYGYFSSFSTLFIGDDLDFCEGEVAALDAGPGKESYLWSTGQTSQTIQVSTPGEYWVKVEREDCVLYDTIQVDVKKGHLDLGPDVTVCRGDTAHIDGKENFSWKWSTGSTEQFLNTTTAGKYWVSVFDYTGCVASDTILLTLKERPPANLGNDILKCREEQVMLDASFPDATFLWENGSTSPTRTIKDAGKYAVKVTWNNGCSATDSLVVGNLPGPVQDSIFGSPSICPYATDIAYRVDAIPNSTYQWFVAGGSIDTMNEHDITVDWFDTNSTAAVKALITDGQGCKSDTIHYPVRINVVLLPEIPFGPDTLCLNKSQQVIYNTPVTNGSVYQWNISGGALTAGQGSAEVIINWSEGLNRLWIEETSVTTDTVCRGVSPELLVYVFEDTTDIILNFVSVDTASANLVHVNWSIHEPFPVKENEVFLHRRAQGDPGWQVAGTSPSVGGDFQDGVDFSTDGVYEYYLSLTNYCDEPLATPVHNNMFLTGIADSTLEVISLSWNPYFGWPEGVDHYEVWRKTDFEPGYRFLARVPNHETAYGGLLSTDAFEHRYVIRALEKGGANESWSSPLSFEFSHPVTIPNIITPNGDEFNQFFHIAKIELYRQSELTIMDRWGKEVFNVVNYQNDWDGDGLSSGVYFYILDLKRDNKVYKGSLTIF